MKAPFVVFEGADGSGKTTLSKIFTQELVNRKLPVFSTCEPTNYEIGKIIRRYLAGEEHDSKEMLFLFIADRIRHNILIEQTLNDGCVVICDRYSLSTRIYQDGCVDEDIIRSLCNNKDFNILPDLLIYVKAPLDIICKRIEDRSTDKSIFETKKENIESNYRKYEAVIRHGWKSYGKKLEILYSQESIDDISEHMKELVEKNWQMFEQFARR